MAKSPILALMEHAVTQYDRRRVKRPGYNPYALAQYMGAADRAFMRYNEGVTLRTAIDEHFNDRLRDAVLKAVDSAGY